MKVIDFMTRKEVNNEDVKVTPLVAMFMVIIILLLIAVPVSTILFMIFTWKTNWTLSLLVGSIVLLSYMTYLDWLSRGRGE